MTEDGYENPIPLNFRGKNSYQNLVFGSGQDEHDGYAMAESRIYENQLVVGPVIQTRSTRVLQNRPQPPTNGIRKAVTEKKQPEKFAKFLFIASILLLVASITLFVSTMVLLSGREPHKKSDSLEQISQLKQEITSLQEQDHNTTEDIARMESIIKEQQRNNNVTKRELEEHKKAINDKEINDNSTRVEIRGLEQKIWRQEKFTGDLESRLLNEFCSNHNGILYNGTCLWEEQRPETLTLVDAHRKCNRVTPSKLPEFYSEYQYNKLMKFLESKIPENRTYIKAWIGLTRNIHTKDMYLSNGKQAPYDNNQDDYGQHANAYVVVNKEDSGARYTINTSYREDNFKENATVLCQALPFTSEPKFKTKEEEIWCRNIGGIAYNGSCLWAEDPPDNMTLSRALKVCNKKRTPSKLPEVYGGQEYIEIMEYLRTKIKIVSIFAWTAMTRNIATNQTMLSDGTSAPYTKPRSSVSRWENAPDYKTNVFLKAEVDTTDNDQGMGARQPTHGFKRYQKLVICQTL